MLRHLLVRNTPPSLRSFTTSLAPLNKVKKAKINRNLFPRPSSSRTTSTNPSTSSSSKEPVPLDSYQLASQINRLCSHSRFNQALNLLHSSPPQAATTITWNVLLNAIFQSPTIASSTSTGNDLTLQSSSTIKRSYEVWMDMKKRGIKPTSRSFGTFLSGCAKLGKRLELKNKKKGKSIEMIGSGTRGQVETVHKQWLMYCAQVVNNNDTGKEDATLEGYEFDNEGGEEEGIEQLSPHPTNQYLSFLTSNLSLANSTTDLSTTTRILEQILTTFESMPLPNPEEPLARNAASYAIVLNALRHALHLSTSLNESHPHTRTTSFPDSTQLIETAIRIFEPLVSTNPLSTTTDPMTPQLSTSFLSLFLIPPASSISYSTQSRILTILSRLHGLVPPDQISSLSPPIDHTVIGTGDPISIPSLDRGALKCVLKLLFKWDRFDWMEGVWEQLNLYGERYFSAGENSEVLDIEHVELVLEGLGRRGDIETAQALINRLLLSPTSSTSTSSSNLKPRQETIDTFLQSASKSGKIETVWNVFNEIFFPSTTTPSNLPTLKPSFKSMTLLLLTSLNTRDRSQIWRALKYLSSSSSSSSKEVGGGVAGVSTYVVKHFGPNAFPPPSTSSTTTTTIGNQEEQWKLRYGQALRTCLSRILKKPSTTTSDSAQNGGGNMRNVIGELEVLKLERWEERVREWVEEREGERFGKGGKEEEGGGGGEMEGRREMVRLKEIEREKNRVGGVPVERSQGGEEAKGGDGERKVQRKERRQGWWKEREGYREEMEKEAKELGRDRVRKGINSYSSSSMGEKARERERHGFVRGGGGGDGRRSSFSGREERPMRYRDGDEGGRRRSSSFGGYDGSRRDNHRSFDRREGGGRGDRRDFESRSPPRRNSFGGGESRQGGGERRSSYSGNRRDERQSGGGRSSERENAGPSFLEGLGKN